MSNEKGMRLKTARKAAGLSQKALGERLRVNQAFLSRVEQGSNDGTVNFWRDVARELDISLDHLLDLEPAERTRPEEREHLDRMIILADYTFPEGLRQLAIDNVLIEALDICDEEWTLLAAIPLSNRVSKAGYLQLLITLRSIDPVLGN